MGVLDSPESRGDSLSCRPLFVAVSARTCIDQWSSIPIGLATVVVFRGIDGHNR